jgi:hypothetical protein
MRRLLVLLGVSLTGLVCGCAPEPVYWKVWQDETVNSSGLVVSYQAHGTAMGRPLTVLLLRYRQGAANAPRFRYTWMQREGEGGRLCLDGAEVVPTNRVRLYVNGPDGWLREVSAPDERLRSLFREGESPGRDELLEFWDGYVRPELEKESPG